MQHKINIQPVDDNLEPVQNLPDRSDLSQLYARSAEVTEEELSVAQKEVASGQAPSFVMRTGLLNVLLVLPVIAMFLNGNYVIQNRMTQDAATQTLFPLISFGLSGVMLVIWVVCMRKLIAEFRNYSLSLPVFLTIYLFYALPLVSLILAVPSKSWTVLSLLLVAYGVASHLAILYISTIGNKAGLSTKGGIFLLALPVLVLAAINMLFI